MGGRVAGKREEEGKRGGEDPDTLRGRRARPSPSRLTCAGSASAHSPSRFAGPPGTCAATLPSRGCRAEQAEGRPERAVAPMELEGRAAVCTVQPTRCPINVRPPY